MRPGHCTPTSCCPECNVWRPGLMRCPNRFCKSHDWSHDTTIRTKSCKRIAFRGPPRQRPGETSESSWIQHRRAQPQSNAEQMMELLCNSRSSGLDTLSGLAPLLHCFVQCIILILPPTSKEHTSITLATRKWRSRHRCEVLH